MREAADDQAQDWLVLVGNLIERDLCALFEDRHDMGAVAGIEECPHAFDYVRERIVRGDHVKRIGELELSEVATDASLAETSEPEYSDSDRSVSELEQLLGVFVDLDDTAGAVVDRHGAIDGEDNAVRKIARERDRHRRRESTTGAIAVNFAVRKGRACRRCIHSVELIGRSQDDRDRPVVHELERHRRAEDAARHGHAQRGEVGAALAR